MKSRVIQVGRIFFAIGLIGIGCQHFYFAQFIPFIVPSWPSGVSGQAICAYLAGLTLVAAGVSILSDRKTYPVCIALAAFFVVCDVAMQLPANIRVQHYSLGAWTWAFKEFAFAGSMLIVAGTSPRLSSGEPSSGQGSGRARMLIEMGKYPVAAMMIAFGIDHFLYPAFVDTLVPGWIPWHRFWTYVAGAALIASGLGIVTRALARLAATLLGAIMFVWVIVLHIPRAVADPTGLIGNELTSVFQALGLSGIAFVLGQTVVQLGDKVADTAPVSLHAPGEAFPPAGLSR